MITAVQFRCLSSTEGMGVRIVSGVGPLPSGWCIYNYCVMCTGLLLLLRPAPPEISEPPIPMATLEVFEPPGPPTAIPDSESPPMAMLCMEVGVERPEAWGVELAELLVVEQLYLQDTCMYTVVMFSWQGSTYIFSHVPCTTW